AQKTKKKKAKVAHRVFDVVAEEPQKPHVAEQMHPRPVQEHVSEEMHETATVPCHAGKSLTERHVRAGRQSAGELAGDQTEIAYRSRHARLRAGALNQQPNEDVDGDDRERDHRRPLGLIFVAIRKHRPPAPEPTISAGNDLLRSASLGAPLITLQESRDI